MHATRNPLSPGNKGLRVVLLWHFCASLHVGHARRSRPVLNYRNTSESKGQNKTMNINLLHYCGKHLPLEDKLMASCLDNRFSSSFLEDCSSLLVHACCCSWNFGILSYNLIYEISEMNEWDKYNCKYVVDAEGLLGICMRK